MAGAARGRGGSPTRKLARHDAEAGSSSRPAVEPWRSKQAHDRDCLSRSGGRSPWAGLNELHANISPHIKRCRDAAAELATAECSVVAGEEGDANYLLAAKEEDALANALRKSAEAYVDDTGFYHDPVAGWYYSSTDGQYYIYENGDYVLWTSDAGKEPNVHNPCDEASQSFLESSSGPEPDIPHQPPSEWLEETLINMYLSGYSNIEVNTENLLGESQISEEGRSEAVENKLSNVASDDASDSLNDATLQQIEDKMQTENFTAAHESLGEEEEKWLSQYGQVERLNDELPLFPSVDLWDWHMVTEPVNKGQPMTRLVGRLTRGSSKLHPSLPARGGLLRTAPVREVHLDLVRVSSGKLYRLRNPSRKHLASLSAYDSSDPTKDWGFSDLYANPDNNSDKLSTACCLSDVAHESSTGEGVSAASGKEHKINTYRDRAAERRILHRGLGIGPGQKQSNTIISDEYEEAIEDMDSLGAAPVDMNLCSRGLKSAKRIMENMGWKEGEALGKSGQGIVEPIQPTFNKHGAGLGWNQTR